MNDTVHPPANSGTQTEAERMYRFFKEVCDGTDVTKFYLDDGGPDVEAAREYAENLRIKLESLLDQKISVSQRVNRVTVKVLA